MDNLRLPLACGCFLSVVQTTDQAALVAYLQEPQIHQQTLRLPYPYTEHDAEAWIHFVLENTGKPAVTVLAIRRPDGPLIGVIGVERGQGASRSTGEIGYWLARPFWGQGIMTQALGAFTKFAFRDLGFLRLEATMFPGNDGSARVLEKAGFQREGYLAAKYFRRGQIIDCIMYGLVNVDAWRAHLGRLAHAAKTAPPSPGSNPRSPGLNGQT